MKFIADAMLGKLAKWLRLMGFDVLYFPDIEDRQLVRIARDQDRTILTRDTGLLGVKGAKGTIFIESDDLPAQLAEMKGRLDFSSAHPLGRCELCNGTLSVVEDKKEIREFVPDFVYHKFSRFARCENCAKVYWEGSHHKRIMERIRRALPPQREEGTGKE